MAIPPNQSVEDWIVAKLFRKLRFTALYLFTIRHGNSMEPTIDKHLDQKVHEYLRVRGRLRLDMTMTKFANNHPSFHRAFDSKEIHRRLMELQCCDRIPVTFHFYSTAMTSYRQRELVQNEMVLCISRNPPHCTLNLS